MEWHRLEVELPAYLGKQTIPVLVLETDEVIEMQNGLIQQGDGTVFLSAATAAVHEENEGKEEKLEINTSGAVTNWFDKEICLSWNFTVYEKGRYLVKVVSTGLHHSNPWAGGHKVSVKTAGQMISAVLEKDEEIQKMESSCYSQVASVVGEIRIDMPGAYELELRANEIKQNENKGFLSDRIKYVGFAFMSVYLVIDREVQK